MSTIRAAHLLIKHTDSRNPLSRRTGEQVTLTPQRAMEEIQIYQERILSEGVHTAFSKYAKERSDWYVRLRSYLNCYHNRLNLIFNNIFLIFGSASSFTLPSVHLFKREEIWAILSVEWCKRHLKTQHFLCRSVQWAVSCQPIQAFI